MGAYEQFLAQKAIIDPMTGLQAVKNIARVHDDVGGLFASEDAA